MLEQQVDLIRKNNCIECLLKFILQIKVILYYVISYYLYANRQLLSAFFSAFNAHVKSTCFWGKT